MSGPAEVPRGWAGAALRARLAHVWLLPRLVKPLLAVPGHAVWLLPTPGFRRAAFGSRGSLGAIAGKSSDPERALRNLLERDRMFTERLGAEARCLGLRVIEVGAPMTEADLAGQVRRGRAAALAVRIQGCRAEPLGG